MQFTCQDCRAEGRTRETCKICKHCLYHFGGCTCRVCSTCDQRFPAKSLCSKCGSCITHHIEGPDIANDFPMRSCVVRGTQCNKCKSDLCQGCGTCKACIKSTCRCPSFHLNPLPVSLGVELELAKWNDFDHERTRNSHINWHFEHDGSVTSGQELVTGIMRGDNYIYGMTALAKKLKEFDCTADKTCGLHVHVDAVKFSPADLRRVMLGFWSIQKSLFGTLVSISRAKNIYCPMVPLSIEAAHEFAKLPNNEISRWFYKYLYQLETSIEETWAPAEKLAQRNHIKARIAQLKSHKYENAARRQAINFHSWMMRGTIEFRCKEGTVNSEDLIMWPLWCGWFIYKIGLMDDKEVFAWMKSPPSIINLSKRLAAPSKGISMPGSVLAWAEKKAGNSSLPKKEPLPDPFNAEAYLTGLRTRGLR